MDKTEMSNLGLQEVNKVEVISLVDNSIDFLSTVSHKKVQSFWQWTKPQQIREPSSQLPVAEHVFQCWSEFLRKENLKFSF